MRNAGGNSATVWHSSWAARTWSAAWRCCPSSATWSPAPACRRWHPLYPIPIALPACLPLYSRVGCWDLIQPFQGIMSAQAAPASGHWSMHRCFTAAIYLGHLGFRAVPHDSQLPFNVHPSGGSTGVHFSTAYTDVPPPCPSSVRVPPGPHWRSQGPTGEWASAAQLRELICCHREFAVNWQEAVTLVQSELESYQGGKDCMHPLPMPACTSSLLCGGMQMQMHVPTECSMACCSNCAFQ